MKEILSIYNPIPLLEAEYPEERVVQLHPAKVYIHRGQVLNKNEENNAIYNFYQVQIILILTLDRIRKYTR